MTDNPFWCAKCKTLYEDKCTCPKKISKKISKKEIFESAIRLYGVKNACEYFNHNPAGSFAANLRSQLKSD